MIYKEYYYELKYINNDCEVVMKFDASIDADDLRDNLRNFLKGCSWGSEVVDNHILAGEPMKELTIEELNRDDAYCNCGRCK